jgi:hypothetical protein
LPGQFPFVPSICSGVAEQQDSQAVSAPGRDVTVTTNVTLPAIVTVTAALTVTVKVTVT